MARQFDSEIYDFQNLSDDEIRDIVRQHIVDDSRLDVDSIDILVRGGHVTLAGRVGTDAEVQLATSIVDDVLGIDEFTNDLVVDELRRGEAPEASDDAFLSDEGTDDQLGEPSSQHSDTAEHLAEDIESETFGTHDMGKAIRDANSYTPPDAPMADGYGSREDH